MCDKFAYRRSAFSLVELGIVTVISGIVAAIAMPRLASAQRNALVEITQGTAFQLQKAVDMYINDHGPGIQNCSDKLFLGLNPFGKNQITCLTYSTHKDGSRDGPFGPYLHRMPANLLRGPECTWWVWRSAQSGSELGAGDVPLNTGWVIDASDETSPRVGYLAPDDENTDLLHVYFAPDFAG